VRLLPAGYLTSRLTASFGGHGIGVWWCGRWGRKRWQVEVELSSLRWLGQPASRELPIFFNGGKGGLSVSQSGGPGRWELRRFGGGRDSGAALWSWPCGRRVYLGMANCGSGQQQLVALGFGFGLMARVKTCPACPGLAAATPKGTADTSQTYL
jgi:hypothetical protein